MLQGKENAMIVGTVCHRCVKAACASYATMDNLEGLEIARDKSKAVMPHLCQGIVVDPVGGKWACSCVHDHSLVGYNPDLLTHDKKYRANP